MTVLSKMARSDNAIEQSLNRALTSALRNRNGVYATMPIGMLQETRLTKRWESDAPTKEDLYMEHGEFKDRLETDLRANLTEHQATNLCCLIAVFAHLGGYLPLAHQEPNDATIQCLAWSTIWCLHEDAGKGRVRKLLVKYMNSELTSQNINALIQDVTNAIVENRLRPQTCANHGCVHLGKAYACQKCRAVFYCSTKCQDLDWPRHKSECRQHRDYAALKKESTQIQRKNKSYK